MSLDTTARARNEINDILDQEVKEVLPEVVHGTPTSTLSLAYDKMVAVLIEAVKELSARVKKLENN